MQGTPEQDESFVTFCSIIHKHTYWVDNCSNYMHITTDLLLDVWMQTYFWNGSFCEEQKTIRIAL